MNNKRYTVNLHITESCNYSCRFCYSKFFYKDLKLKDWKAVVDNLTNSGLVNRINLAGGEPLVYRGLQELIDYIYDKGLEVTLITNGSLLTKSFIEINRNKISTIGISVDSLDTRTNRFLGRCDSRNKVLDMETLVGLCEVINRHNIRLKINTVVNKLNYKENIYNNLIKNIKVDRWKILEMQNMIDINEIGHDLKTNNEEFNDFLNLNEIVNLSYSVIERDNDFRNAYLFVNNNGLLLDNSGYKHIEIGNLMRDSFEEIFHRFNFNNEAYDKRY